MESVTETGSFIESSESVIDKLGLTFSLKNITTKGASLVFKLNEKGTTSGLQYGEDFSLQVEKNGAWEDVPIIIKGSYGFKAIAYTIPSEHDVHWEWLYGSLSPGIYRLSKNILDVRLNSGPVHYKIYAHFKIY